MPCSNDISSSSESHDSPFSRKLLKSYDVENKVCNHGTVYSSGKILYDTVYHFRPDLSNPLDNFCHVCFGFGGSVKKQEFGCLSRTSSPYTKGTFTVIYSGLYGYETQAA